MSEGIAIKNLSVTFRLPGLNVRAVDGVSADFPAGSITGLIGESGCGKSVLGLALMGLLPPYAQVSGTIAMNGEILTPAGARKRLGTQIGLIPQNPSDSLNPARTISAHLKEAMLPLKCSRQETRRRSRQLMQDFGFSDPQRILKAYPHELSGGMQQRVLCAIGSACCPPWILADEPTKGLDRDLREQVQQTLLSLRHQGVQSMLVITHDLPLAKGLCSQLAVMYAGQILEVGKELLDHPCHPYTQAFLAALPEQGFQPMEGVAPRAGERLPGCPFAPRCPYAQPRCHRERPGNYSPIPGRMVRCFRYE